MGSCELASYAWGIVGLGPRYHTCAVLLAYIIRHALGELSSSSSQLLCRAAFNAAYSHTGCQARELVKS